MVMYEEVGDRVDTETRIGIFFPSFLRGEVRSFSKLYDVRPLSTNPEKRCRVGSSCKKLQPDPDDTYKNGGF